MDSTQLRTVREAIGVAISSGKLTAPVVASLTELNSKIIDETYLELKGQTPLAIALAVLLNAPTTQAESSYSIAVGLIAIELAKGTVIVPPPGPTPVVEPVTDELVERVIAALETRNLKLRGEIEIHNRLFVGDAIDEAKARGLESAYAIQMMCKKSATINGVSNLDGLQIQSPAPHFGYLSFNYDGGLLAVQNAGYLKQPDGSFAGKDFIDPTREISTNGVDSRGTWIYDLREPGREYREEDSTQSVWIRPDDDAKTIDVCSPRVGYDFRFRGSSRRDPILKVILDKVKSILWDT